MDASNQEISIRTNVSITINHILDMNKCNIIDDPMSTSRRTNRSDSSNISACCSKDDNDDADDDEGPSANITTNAYNITRTQLSSLLSHTISSSSLPSSASSKSPSAKNIPSPSKHNARFPTSLHRRTSSAILPVSSSSMINNSNSIPILNPCTYMMKLFVQNNNNDDDNNKEMVKTKPIRRIDSFSLEQASYFEPYQESEIKNELLMALRSSNVDQLRSLMLCQDDENNNNSRSTSLSLLQDVKACNQFGENLLHLACRMGISRELVTFLFHDCQVPLNVRDKFGRTPLHNSCMSTVPHFDNINFVISKAPKMLLFEDDNGKIPFDLIPPQCFEPWTQFLLSEEETGGKNLLRQAAEAIPW